MHLAFFNLDSAKDRQPSVVFALRSHVRLLDESKKWPLSRAEPLESTTEALLARALSWEPRRHDGASAGVVCLSVLRTVRQELGHGADKKYATALRDLVSLPWRLGNRIAVEDGGECVRVTERGPDWRERNSR